MKALKITLFALIAFVAQHSFASSVEQSTPETSLKGETFQDTLYLKDGRILPITFISETPLKVKFKKSNDGTGRSWTKDKSAVDKIVMSDGTVKSYSTSNNQNNQSSNNGKTAVAFGAATAVIVIVAVLAVLAGLIIILNAL